MSDERYIPIGTPSAYVTSRSAMPARVSRTAASARNRTRAPEATRERLVNAAFEQIHRHGYQGAGLDSPFRPARDHAATEQLLADSGVPWTSLRNGFYAHSLNWLAGAWRETGVISVPADGPVSWTARADAAEAAAIILASNGRYQGPTTLTAAAAPTFGDIAEITTELTGGKVECVILAEDEWLAAQTANGMPESAARFTLGMYQAAQDGRFSGVDPLLGELLDREPRTVRDLLSEPTDSAAM